MGDILSMNFLKTIDQNNEEDRRKNKVQDNNSEYRYYEKVIPLDFHSEIDFTFLKVRKKIKILMCFGTTKIYLSDLDIIKIITEMHEEAIKWFINNLINLYKNKGVVFKFSTCGLTVEGEGLPYEEGEIKVNLFSDNEIHINDFIFVLNLILLKDELATQQQGPKNWRDIIKITLCKYISLIKFYGLHDDTMKKVLCDLDYPVEKCLDDVYSSYSELIRINKIFENIEKFEKKLLL